MTEFFIFLIAICFLIGLAIFIMWCGLVVIRWVFPTRAQRLADKRK